MDCLDWRCPAGLYPFSDSAARRFDAMYMTQYLNLSNLIRVEHRLSLGEVLVHDVVGVPLLRLLLALTTRKKLPTKDLMAGHSWKFLTYLRCLPQVEEKT